MTEFQQNGAACEASSSLLLIALVWLRQGLNFWNTLTCSRSVWRRSRVCAWKRQGEMCHINCFPSQSTKARWTGEAFASILLGEENLTPEPYYRPCVEFCPIDLRSWVLTESSNAKQEAVWLFILYHVFITERQERWLVRQWETILENTVHSSFLFAKGHVCYCKLWNLSNLSNQQERCR